MVAEPSDDHRLVAAVRRGDNRAFEALYARYHRRIHAYVMGMVKDHGRAEDVTQEVFVSALRRMRETERPIAFKPWIYEIAKNACIDQFRRSRRAEEVSLEADEGLAPSDYGKLVGSDPTPDAAVAAKQDLDHLCGAMGGLSDTHHEILVMREFEGMSYREIGDRLGMSRPAVESTLFRARRRLTEEYDDLVSGARCQRIQSLIAAAGESRLGTRESRRLSRHVAHCQPCRREAMAAGLDSAILTHVPLRKRAAEKIAGLLPFGWFGRGRGSDLATHAPILSDQLSNGWGKLATAAAVLVAGVGAAGVGTEVVMGGGDEPSAADRPAALERTAAPAKSGASGNVTRATLGTVGPQEKAAKKSRKADRRPERDARVQESGGGDTGGTPPAGVSSGSVPAGSGAGAGGRKGLPKLGLPAGGDNPIAPVKQTVEDTVGGVVEGVQPVVEGVTDTVEQTGNGVQDTVDQAGGTLNDTVEGAGETVDETVKGVGGTVNGLAGGIAP
jgi:RNA polymerase sigma factor (sigma-70 family)